MYLNKLLTIALLLALLPVHANAIFGLKARKEQKQMLADARAAYAAADYPLAVQISQELILKDAPRRRIKRAYNVLGDAYKAMGSYDKALLVYTEALEFYPNDTGFSLGLADIYYTGGLIDKAVEVYSSVLTRVPGSLQAHLGLARSYYLQGFFARACGHFEDYISGLSAVDGAPAEAGIYKEYAFARYGANNFEEALRLAALVGREDALALAKAQPAVAAALQAGRLAKEIWIPGQLRPLACR